jgi:hypothetical protein
MPRLLPTLLAAGFAVIALVACGNSAAKSSPDMHATLTMT